uniref:G protein-coupled receptor n=1 Tax=Haemonchus contortus TaxID=6289 RepID=A0A7I4Y1Y3_HAECO
MITIQCHYCAFYMLQLVRLVTIFYEVGIIAIDEVIDFPSVFISVCYTNILLKTSCVTLFPSILFERFVASNYIDDYEKKSRPWVAILALALSFVLSAAYTTALVFGFLGVDKVIMLSTAVCIVFSIVFVMLYRRNSRRLNEFITKNPSCYELSARFQLVENLRALKIIRNASVAFTVWLPLPCVMIVLAHLYFLAYTDSGQIVFASFELVMSLSIAALFVFSIVALGATPKMFRMWNCGSMLRTKVNDEYQQYRNVITEKYFQHLHSSWT